MVLLSIFSTGVFQSVDAFNIGLPDIPFLNFNFEDESPKAESSSIIDMGPITNIIPKSNSGEDINDNSDSKLEDAYNSNSIGQSNDESNGASSVSLPFPANMMNTPYSNENENTDGNDKTTLNLPDSLPLFGDYSDFPSTFLSDTQTTAVPVAVATAPAAAEADDEDDVIAGQYIVVFKDDKTTVTDFFAMLSTKIDTQDIEVLKIYENVLNGLTIRVPDEKIIEAVEQLPLVDYIEKDMMAEAFAQTLPSAVLNFLAQDKEPMTPP
jgi:subtilisin